MAAARKALDEVSDMTYQGRSLNDVINDLKAKAKLNVILDPMVFQFGLDPNQPIVNVSQKDVKVQCDGLKAILTPYNLRFGLIREGLYISTEDGVTAKQLKQRVSVECESTPFAVVAKQLAADTGGKRGHRPAAEREGQRRRHAEAGRRAAGDRGAAAVGSGGPAGCE